MVKILAVLVALTAVAHAQEDGEGDGDDDGIDHGPPLLLGFRIAAGKLPVEHQALTTMALGLDVDHPMTRTWRAFGEYEWMWLDRDEMSSQHGSGHRMLAGLRHTLVEKREHHFRGYVDVDAGGGMAMVDDTVLGVRMLPTGFAGVRGGYGFTAADSPSRVFDVEVIVRALFVPDGTGVMAGLGLQWGN